MISRSAFVSHFSCLSSTVMVQAGAIKYYFVVFSLSLAVPSENARILGIFQTPAYSHQVVYRALTEQLLARGHTMTIMTTDPAFDGHPNVTEISFKSSYKVFNRIINYVDAKQKQLSQIETLNQVMDLGLKLMSEQLNHPEVKQIIKEHELHRFDLLIIEYFNFVPMLAFAELFDCPAIGITSMETSHTVHGMFGNPTNSVIHPDSLIFSHEHGKLTFVERLVSLVLHNVWKLFIKPNLDKKLMKLTKEHFPTVTTEKEKLEQRLKLFLANMHPLMGSIRQVVPNFIQLGFMHIKPSNSLSEGALKTFLDGSKHGAILISFGSNVKSKDFSPELREVFIEVFKKWKYNVVWKFELDELPNKPHNMMIAAWLPQADVLAHPNLKLLVCQGGQQTIEEAIDREVPLVVIPFIEEQESNANKLVERKIGFRLNFHTLNEANLKAAIEEMIKPQYKDNIKKLKSLIYDQPMNSLEKAVWWTEHSIGHETKQHKTSSIPLYQRNWLDIVCFVGFVFFLITKTFDFISYLEKMQT